MEYPHPPTPYAGPPRIQSQCDNPNICHPLATCIQSMFAVTCICPPHFSGNGIGRFGCVQSNSTLDGCSPNPCQNGGTCVSLGPFGYRCECPNGTVEPRCARQTSICTPNPCQNGGTCTAINRWQYRCACTATRTGRNCQTEARSCGGVLNSYNGTLKYPLTGTYQHNSRCAWLIKTDEDKVLNVTFSNFRLEHSRECRFDWLQVSNSLSARINALSRSYQSFNFHCFLRFMMADHLHLI